ncbi:hypothetical protein U1Q18_030011 [Sarracenia purpurea var. burkii]
MTMAVLRRGKFHLSEGLANAEITEALSGYHAIQTVLSLGLTKIQLEGDAIFIIKTISSSKVDISYIDGIIKSSKVLA